MQLSDPTKKLIEQYALAHKKESSKPGSTTIHVDEVALRVAAFYEQIRTVVDWKEEHLMRRASIIRKLKRRFFDLQMNGFSGTGEVAESLVLELIRGGLFPNDKIEETKIGEVQKIIDKYISILKENSNLQFYNWLIEVAACEVEETLAPSIKEMALIEFMFNSMKQKIKISDKLFEQGLLKKEDASQQIYIAVCEALFKLDKPMISYNLLRQKNWGQQELPKNIFKFWEKLEKDLASPIANKFYNICEKYDTPYLLLGDILSINNPAEVGKEIAEPQALESYVKDAYLKRLAGLKARISRAAIYSTISIFVTKVLSLVILEIIIEEAFGGKLNFVTLAADVVIPTFLMFLIVSSIKKPSKKNLNLVCMETMKVAYETEPSEFYEIKAARKKSPGVAAFLSLVYVISAFVTFGGIIFVLHYFGFSVTSIIIDIIFIALILFAGTAVAKRAQELTMEEEKESFFSFLSDVFFLPMQGLGRWISTKWKKYNAITAFFNALIDTPFSAFVDFIEKWRYFIKERKEEIR